MKSELSASALQWLASPFDYNYYCDHTFQIITMINTKSHSAKSTGNFKCDSLTAYLCFHPNLTCDQGLSAVTCYKMRNKFRKRIMKNSWGKFWKGEGPLLVYFENSYFWYLKVPCIVFNIFSPICLIKKK